jgi:hypothetical protein
LIPAYLDQDIGYLDDDFLNHQFHSKYSLITFFDVLEHIADMQQALDKAFSILTNDGTIYLYIGNYKSLQFVQHEPHYRLPLITLLPYKIAINVLMRLERIREPGEYVVTKWPEYNFFTDQLNGCFILDARIDFRTQCEIQVAMSPENVHFMMYKLLQDMNQYLDQYEFEITRCIIDKYIYEYTALLKCDPQRHFIEYCIPSWNIFMAPTAECLSAISRELHLQNISQLQAQPDMTLAAVPTTSLLQKFVHLAKPFTPPWIKDIVRPYLKKKSGISGKT